MLNPWKIIGEYGISFCIMWTIVSFVRIALHYTGYIEGCPV